MINVLLQIDSSLNETSYVLSYSIVTTRKTIVLIKIFKENLKNCANFLSLLKTILKDLNLLFPLNNILNNPNFLFILKKIRSNYNFVIFQFL